MSMLPRPVAAVILDMDGLLLDTEQIYVSAIMEASRSIGFSMSKDFCHSMIGIPGRECDRLIQDHFGPAFPMEAYSKDCNSRIARLFDAGIPLKPGAAELVDHLWRAHIPTAVATSSSRKTATQNLNKAGLLDRLGVVVTRDDVVRGKPDPELFVKAAALLNIPAQNCMSLEDSFNGIRAAHSAQTMPITVPDIVRPTLEIRALCIAVVDSLHEARELLTAH